MTIENRRDEIDERLTVSWGVDGLRTFHRNNDGQIVYDDEGYIGGGGGYPYITIGRDRVATEADIEDLLQKILPRKKIK